jgi:hypothetical protein
MKFAADVSFLAPQGEHVILEADSVEEFEFAARNYIADQYALAQDIELENVVEVD